MKILPIEPDLYIKKTPQSRFLQSVFWAQFKSNHGWKAFFFEVSEISLKYSEPYYCAVLVRRFSRFASLCYIPMAPEIGSCFDNALTVCLARAIQQYMPKNCLCIRFDPPYALESGICTELSGKDIKPFIKSITDVQPPDTVLLDLSLSCDELLDRMKPKWRYNIRLAEKKGVCIRRAPKSDIGVFYDLYKETAKRDGIAIHALEYYKDLLSLSDSMGASCGIEIRLYIAEHEGEPIAAIITLHSAYESVYVYGASSNVKRNLMATYLLQWHAIQDSKTYGSRWYDFYGIPPTDDEGHPMHGLYRFKTGFGGSIVHRAGSLDMPIKPVRYALYRRAEQFRAFWYKKIKKMEIYTKLANLFGTCFKQTKNR